MAPQIMCFHPFVDRILLRMATIYDMKFNVEVSIIILELYHSEMSKEKVTMVRSMFFHSKCGGMAKGKCF